MRPGPRLQDSSIRGLVRFTTDAAVVSIGIGAASTERPKSRNLGTYSHSSSERPIFARPIESHTLW